MVLKKRLFFIVMAFVLTLSSFALLFAPSNNKIAHADSLEDRYNLFVFPSKTISNVGVNLSNDGKYLYLNGRNTASSYGYLSFEFAISIGTYTFSVNSIDFVSFYFVVDNLRYNFTGNSITFNVSNNSTFNFNLKLDYNASFNNAIIMPMLNTGSISYPYMVPLSSNESYYYGFQNGYNQGYQDSLKDNSFPNVNDSQGVFEYADLSFTYYRYDNLPFENNLTSISNYLSNFSNNSLQYNLRDYANVIGYNNGISTFRLNSNLPFTIFSRFTTSSEPFEDYSHYRLLFNSAVKFSSNLTLLKYYNSVYQYYNKTGNIVSRVDLPIFYAFYSDGSSSLLSTDNYQSFVELDLNKSVIAIDIIFRDTQSSIPTIIPGFTTLDVQQAYNNGYQEGNKNGYDNGYVQGSQFGYDKGYRDGLSLAEDSDLVTFVSAVVGAPVSVVSKFLNFNILGVNILGFVSGLVTLLLVVKVISIFLGRK